MRKRVLGALLAVLGTALPAGCPIDGVPCTELYAYGLTVRLSDAATGDPISGATLVLTEGAYIETMQELSAEFNPGAYVGAGERPGIYTLTVQAEGYQSTVIQDIVIVSDVCHVIGRALDVQLSPN